MKEAPVNHQDFSDWELARRTPVKPEAFGIIFERHKDKIRAYCLNRTRNPLIAEDLTSQTFMNIFRRIGHYEEREAPFTALLFQAAKNNIRAWKRKQEKRKERPILKSNGDQDLADLVIPGRHPEKAVLITERIEILKRAVGQLSESHQQLLILKYVEGMSYQEISLVMKKGTGALESLHRRSLKTLKTKMQWQ